MKPRLVLSLALATVIFLGFSGKINAQEKLTDTVIKSVITTAFEDIAPEDIKIKMKKKLTSRYKINVEVQGRNAILYLSYKRYRNGARWWFENDPEKSLVYLSKTYKTTRKDKSLYERKTAAKEEPAVARRTETITVQQEVKKKEKNKPARIVAERKPTSEAKKTELKKVVEKEKVVEAKPEAQTVIKPDQVQEKPEIKTVEVQPEPVKIKKVEAEKVVTKEAEAAPETEQTETIKVHRIEKTVPVEEEKPEDKLPEAAPATPLEKPVKETQPQVAVEKAVAQKAVTAEVPAREEEAAVEDEAEVDTNAPVPVELATGPEGTSKEFIVTLVDHLIKGNDDQYRNFLLRPSEMAMDVDEKDFERGVELWLEQFTKIHESLAQAENVTVRQIILQRARTDEIERATVLSLQKRISSVNKVFTYVKINLLLDGQPGYISIGGLMQTDNGWRIGGRISFTQQLSLQ